MVQHFFLPVTDDFYNNEKRLYGYHQPKKLKNPDYTNLSGLGRKKPIGGVQVSMIKPSFDSNYLTLYYLPNTKILDIRSDVRFFKKTKYRKYLRKISKNQYDLDYEKISQDFDIIQFTFAYCKSELFEAWNDGDVLILHPHVVNIYPSDITKARKQFILDIQNLGLTTTRFRFLKEIFGSSSRGSIFSIKDLVTDIVYNDGAFILNIPNIGKRAYDIIKKSFIDHGLLPKDYTPYEAFSKTIQVSVTSDDEYQKIIKLLNDTGYTIESDTSKKTKLTLK